MENEKLFDDVTQLLKEHDLTYKWLNARLTDIGLTINKVSMSKWVHGNQITSKAYKAHDMAIKIIETYAKFATELKEIEV